MAAVQQRVLNWLYSVLTSEYRDVNRTYNDVAQTLSHYSSLAPRTDVYTYENGASALLLHISGTLPVTFRGTTYRFPIALWIPHAYPHEAPLVYVTPVEGMMVRAGQHVDPQGKVYHPYLVGWAEYWDKSNILDFLAILRDVFAKEPPVISRQPQNAPPRPQSAAIPPPIPPLPPNQYQVQRLRDWQLMIGHHLRRRSLLVMQLHIPQPSHRDMRMAHHYLRSLHKLDIITADMGPQYRSHPMVGHTPRK
ncbi:UEV domain-containing protein [Rutstroemia sp. NJR-2017a BBW]|nr:UEV domain-containing protein [Rutstroemia sp. NJR-2017a BBW]